MGRAKPKENTKINFTDDVIRFKTQTVYYKINWEQTGAFVKSKIQKSLHKENPKIKTNQTISFIFFCLMMSFFLSVRSWYP